MTQHTRRVRGPLLLTEGTPYKQILRFALPLLIGNLFQQFYNMADAFVISRTLGVEAFAGVSCTGSITFFVLGFAQGLTMGMAIPIAQSYGAQDTRRVRLLYAHDLLLLVGGAAVLTALSLTFVDRFLVLMRTPAEIFDYASSYLRVVFCGIIASMLYNFFSGVLRALGDSRSPLYFLFIASGLNILLDFVLVRYTPLGVAGAGLATVLSQGISALLCFGLISKKVQVLSLAGYREKLQPALLWESLHMGLPMGFQSSIIAIGAIMMQFATNNMGTVAVAAYAAASKVDSIAGEPLCALGATMSTFTGQNFGAGRYKRIRQGVRQCAVLSAIVWLTLGTAVIFGGRALTILYIGHAEETVLSQAHLFLKIHGALYYSLGLLYIFRFTLQGLGKTLVPTLSGFMELIMRVVAALFLVPRYEFVGAAWATPLAWIAAAIPLAAACLLELHRLPQEEETMAST